MEGTKGRAPPTWDPTIDQLQDIDNVSDIHTWLYFIVMR